MCAQIISSIATLAGIVAAIVAIWGNVQSQKQFRINMNLQIQALNLNLYDDRVKVCRAFEKDQFNFDVMRLSLLFDEEIVRKFLDVDRLNTEKMQCDKLKMKCVELLNDKAPPVNDTSLPNFPNLISLYGAYLSGKTEEYSHEKFLESENVLDNFPQRLVINGKDMGSHTYPRLCKDFTCINEKLSDAKKELIKSVTKFIQTTEKNIKEVVK